MQPQTDEELLASYYETKDTKFQTEAFIQNSHLLFRTARQYFRNTEDAEDIVQMAYLKFVQNIDQYKQGTNLKAWLVRITINLCLDKYREEAARKKREEKSFTTLVKEKEQEMGTVKEKEYLKRAIRAAIEKLPEKYRLPIWLVHYENLSFKEASLALEIPEKTIRSQVARGLEKVKDSVHQLQPTLSITGIAVLMHETELELLSTASIQKIQQMALEQSAIPKQLRPRSSRRMATKTAASSSSITGFIVAAGIIISAAVFVMIKPTSPAANTNKTAINTTPVEIKNAPIALENQEYVKKVWDMKRPEDRILKTTYGTLQWDEATQSMIPALSSIGDYLLCDVPLKKLPKTFMITMDVYPLIKPTDYKNRVNILGAWQRKNTLLPYKIGYAKDRKKYTINIGTNVYTLYFHNNHIVSKINNKILEILYYDNISPTDSITILTSKYGLQKLEYAKLESLPDDVQDFITKFDEKGYTPQVEIPLSKFEGITVGEESKK